MPQSTNEGLYAISGMHGSAWRDGHQLSDAIAVAVTVEVADISLPTVGTTTLGHKPGRETRSGSINVQKKDTSWEMQVYRFLSQSLEERRRNRGSGRQALAPFQLQLEYDDPDALGYELWQLEGCQIWRLTLGFGITDESVEREYPLTWMSETPLAHFERTGGINTATGLPQVIQTGDYPH